MLRGKLARLASPPSASRAPSWAASPSAPIAPDADKLDELRSKMSEILGRKSMREPPEIRGELPFDTVESDRGALHVRRVMLGLMHRVGRGSPSLARAASPEVLALLALDPQIAGVNLSRALYIDTETTGLAGGTGTVAFLVGLAFFDDDGRLVLEQLLVKNLGEEGPMLAHLATRIKDASCLVSFNGKSFDMPLLRTRFRMARREPPAEPPHLDLLHVARRIHRGEPAGANKLTALEQRLFGFSRVDDVPSGDVSACYMHFLRTGDTRGLVRVVEHNAWDVSSMAALVAFYGEPFSANELRASDLVNVARTLKRARKFDDAKDVATRAIRIGAGAEGYFMRGDIEKARGDKARALADFELAAQSVEDARTRLELAKLYEHWKKDPHRALKVAREGTGESEPQKRLVRLEKKTAGALFDRDGNPTAHATSHASAIPAAKSRAKL